MKDNKFSIQAKKGRIDSIERSLEYYNDLIEGLVIERQLLQMDINDWEKENGPAGEAIDES